MSTAHFRHTVFDNQAIDADEPVWVFIDGDGNAWLRNGLAAEDPTPSVPLALDLMVQMSQPAIYLGRPCMFAARTDPRCDPAVWTVDRYSEAVVASMTSALAARLAHRRIVVVGFSGGGVLALHLAQRLEHCIGVLTIAANLDVARWADHHGYAAALAQRSVPLHLPLRAGVVQLHVFGGRDANAPLALAANLLEVDKGAQIKVFDEADHDCCWSELWPRIAAQFQQLMDASEVTRASSSVR